MDDMMAVLKDGAAFVGGTSLKVSLLCQLDDGVSKSDWCWIRSSTSRLDREGGGATFVWRNVLGEWIVAVLRQTLDGVSKDDVVYGWITRQ
jgi:hypothetical protein